MNQDKAQSASAVFASVYFQILCMEKVIHVGKWCVCKCVLFARERKCFKSDLIQVICSP